MAKITFKAKPRIIYTIDNKIDYIYLKVPTLKSSHCDMQAFRQHKKYGGYANSLLFPAMLARIKENKFPTGTIKLEAIPVGVTINGGGLLTQVSFEV